MLGAGEGVLRVVLFRSWHVAHCRDVLDVPKKGPFDLGLKISCFNVG